MPRWQALLFGVLCIACCFGVWHVADPGRARRADSKPGACCPAPANIYQFHSLWFDRALTRNMFASLQRVALGSGWRRRWECRWASCAAVFPWINAFLAPVTIFGRNIPLAALIPLTYSPVRDRRSSKGDVHLHRLAWRSCCSTRRRRSTTSTTAISTRHTRWEPAAGRSFCK